MRKSPPSSREVKQAQTPSLSKSLASSSHSSPSSHSPPLSSPPAEACEAPQEAAVPEEHDDLMAADEAEAAPWVGIVGIGASAGGLEALRSFVANLPVATRFSYVVAQHLSPTHVSMLVPLLARESKLPVLEVTEGLEPQANVVYITPARWNISIKNRRIHLEEATKPGTPKPSIDIFFASLAEDLGEMAIGIVLSGTGSDGARGIRAIRAVGGITFAQDEGSAKYSGMPRSAVDSGCIDYVLSPEAIARHLESIAHLPVGQELLLPNEKSHSFYEQIFDMVRQQSGVDFRLYKETTVGRRVRRRMVATECASLEDYYALLKKKPEEIQKLSQEILISVTSFFRENEAFDVLRGAIDRIIQQKVDNEDVRVWIAGCATGEEAYSIAILFFEAFKRANRTLRLQIFATDIDVGALAKARRGVFQHDELLSVTDDRARNYFTHTSDYVQVSKPLRESILFSVHNLVRDPVFLRLDLVSCRNVLIYFKSEVQSRLLRTFHGALRPGGHLFLGRSETTHQHEKLFTPIDERARIYVKNEVLERMPRRERDYLESTRIRPGKSSVGPRVVPLSERVLQAISGHLFAGAVIVDEELNIKHIYGDVSSYLTFQAGEPNLNLYSLALPSLRIDIRSMVMKVQRTPEKSISHVIQIKNSARFLRIHAIALRAPSKELSLFLVTLQEVEHNPKNASSNVHVDSINQEEQRIALEEQLAATREHLQTVIEQLETSNEELQSLNEELASANEELQSTNEELETSNEELQSTNEELTTVNEELETKTHELIRLNSDLKNVKDSLQYPILVLDEHLRVTLYNPPAAQLFQLSAVAVGHHFFSIPSKLDLSDLRPKFEEVIRTGESFERQFEGENFYLLCVHPYVDEGNTRKGVVLTLIDNSDIKRAEERLISFTHQLEQSERFAKSTIDALSKHICVINEMGEIIAINQAWRDFGTKNGTIHSRSDIGSNYLEVCYRALTTGDKIAERFLNGLQAVMKHQTDDFCMEYPCHSSTEELWFEVRVTRFQGEGPQFFVISHEDISARKKEEQLILLQSQALDGSMNGIVIAAVQGNEFPLVYVNKAFEEITGYSKEEVLGRDCKFLQGKDRVQPNLLRIRVALKEGKEERVLLRNYRKDGALFWNELSIYPIKGMDGRIRHFVGIQRDITSVVSAEDALRASLERERLALSFAGVGLFSWDVRGGHINASDIMLRLLGLAGGSSNLDQNTYRNLIHEEDRPIFDDAVKLCLAGHQSLDIEYRLMWPDSSIHWIHTKGDVEITSMGLPQRLLCLSQDITVRKESDDRVRFIAHHDALTGLPNRTLLRDRLQQALSSARRNKTKVAVNFIDLDHFKCINDSLGHHIGDLLLQAVGNRLKLITRDNDTICRYSGDEYIVVLPNVHDSGEAAHVAEKIIEALSSPYQIENIDVVITPSVGVSMYPDDGDKVDTLIRNADAAMYHAKGNGRKNFQFFMPEINKKEHDRLTVTTELRRALERGEFQVHYQPQMSVKGDQIVGIEALIRWLHPERGIIFPNEFIPIAEDSELIISIGEWVLGEACRQTQEWTQRGLIKVPIAVNFSAVQFRQRGIISKVAQALRESGLIPSLLEIELTESAIMHNASDAADTLISLHQLGIRLVIDDFGTGYSSLQHLHHFPIDKLKIDRSFIADLPGDKNAASIVKAMVMLGENLHLDVVAEGVETEAQLSFLRDNHCLTYQGHYKARALPPTLFVELLTALQPSL